VNVASINGDVSLENDEVVYGHVICILYYILT